jgi:catechol 2,3-dioxygenase-like lactoylglutathione lyase family enzyme
MMKGLHAVLPAADLQRAQAFYHDKLELDPEAAAEDGSLMYRISPETGFELYETPNAGTAQNTQMGWLTDDLEAEVARLRDRGVVFEEYDMPGLKTVDSIATMGDTKAAWLRDTEGNFLCITQRG